MSADPDMARATLAAAIIATRGAKSIEEIANAWLDARHIINPAPSNLAYKAWQLANGSTPTTADEDAKGKQEQAAHGQAWIARMTRGPAIMRQGQGLLAVERRGSGSMGAGANSPTTLPHLPVAHLPGILQQPHLASGSDILPPPPKNTRSHRTMPSLAKPGRMQRLLEHIGTVGTGGESAGGRNALGRIDGVRRRTFMRA